MKLEKNSLTAIVVIIALSVALASFGVLYYQEVNKSAPEQEVSRIPLLYSVNS